MKRIMTMMAVALMAVAAKADMTYAPSALGVLNDATGTPMSDGTYLLVLDRDNDGFDFNNLVGTSWAFDADDFIMDRGAIGSAKGVNGEWDGDAFPFWTVSTANIPAGYTAGVDQYYMFWFDKSYSASDIGPGASVHFGVENLGAVGSDPGAYTPDLIGGNAQYTTQAIPEPASAALALLGGGMVYAVRRRMRQYRD